MKKPKPNQRSATNLDKALGQRIRIQRNVVGMSQQELGDALGVSFQQIQKYEKGTNRVGATRLVQIAKALKTSANALTTDIGVANKETAAVMDFMFTAQGVRLAKAFMNVPEGDKRHTLIVLAEHMAA